MPFADTYNKTVYVDEDVQPTGTPDLASATLNNNEDFTKLLSTGLADYSADLEALTAQVASISVPLTDIGFIRGLTVDWDSNTQIRITHGACYVPGATGAGQATTETVLTPTRAASTWYYVYANKVGSSLTFESSTTSSTRYFGESRHMTGDQGKRLIGTYRTDASSNIIRQSMDGSGWVRYETNMGVSPLQVATNQQQTTSTNISCANVVPPAARVAEITIDTYHTANSLLIANPNMGSVSSTNWLHWLNVDNSGYKGMFKLDASQQFNYIFTGAPGAGAWFHVSGYRLPR